MNTTNPLESFIKDMDSFFYGGNGWQAGMYQLVSDLNFKQASWKPSNERNSIWKIVKHVIFWKFTILSDAKGKPLSVEERRAGDWRNIPSEPTEELWQNEISELKDTHQEFKELIKNYGVELFNTKNEDVNYIRENLCHDTYHAGQIGLLRVLQGIPAINY